jgi:hypothetical protein
MKKIKKFDETTAKNFYQSLVKLEIMTKAESKMYYQNDKLTADLEQTFGPCPTINIQYDFENPQNSFCYLQNSANETLRNLWVLSCRAIEVSNNINYLYGEIVEIKKQLESATDRPSTAHTRKAK